MAYSNEFKKYQEQYVNTMTPGELVTLLYNEIIKNLNKSIIAIHDKKIGDAHNKIIKAQDILLHFINNLDYNYSISTNFLSLYEYMYDSLVKANVEKNAETIQHVINLVTDLKSTWVQAEKMSRTGSNMVNGK